MYALSFDFVISNLCHRATAISDLVWPCPCPCPYTIPLPTFLLLLLLLLLLVSSSACQSFHVFNTKTPLCCYIIQTAVVLIKYLLSYDLNCSFIIASVGITIFYSLPSIAKGERRHIQTHRIVLASLGSNT
jgi:hypothetical protein